jgi:hypothetical protein
MGDKNASWKGDNVGYGTLHQWVRKHNIRPSLCQICDKKTRLDLANITGIYNRDFKNWMYLCRRCHMSQDGRLDNPPAMVDMTGRVCSRCKSDKTYRDKNMRYKWHYINGKLVCSICYDKERRDHKK